MTCKPLAQRLTAEEALDKIKAQGGSILFEKVLTSSDVSGAGRLVIPKSHAEAHFPRLEEQSGVGLAMTDTEGQTHALRLRFWANNQSRMYLLEHTSAVQARYRMQAGDVLVFSRLPDGRYGIAGRKGTKDDVSRKPPTRRGASAPPDGEAPGGGRKRGRSRGDSLKAKRMRQKAAVQEVQRLMGFWSALSLPPRRDGVFRAVPASAVQAGDRVVAQYGAWSALVNLGGELFQAFFDTHDAAAAAVQAALQSEGRAEPVANANGTGGGCSDATAREGSAQRAAAGPSSQAASEGAEAAGSATRAAQRVGAPAAEMTSPSQAASPAAACLPHGQTGGPPAGAAQGAQLPLEAAAEPEPGKSVRAQQVLAAT